MKSDSTESWVQWSKYVVEAIKELKVSIEKLSDEINDIKIASATIKFEASRLTAESLVVCQAQHRQQLEELEDKYENKLMNIKEVYNKKVKELDAAIRAVDRRILKLEFKAAGYGATAGMLTGLVLELLLKLL